MKDNAFDCSGNGDICYLSNSFTEMNKDNRRGILKTAKHLLKTQMEGRFMVVEKPSQSEKQS